MVKRLEFKDFHADVTDSDGDTHKHTVKAAVVDDDTSGEYVTRDGVANVKKGSVLVQTERADVYDVHNEKAWADGSYESDDDSGPDDAQSEND